MKITLTCENCGSGIHILPSLTADKAECSVCQHQQSVAFNEDHMSGALKDCPCCERKDFYKQKDFNRKIGVILFVIAAILSIWTYGVSLIVLYLMDLFLYRRLSEIVICYKCATVFRGVGNMDLILGFDHEMNDRIVYADHNFEGKPLNH